MHSGFIIPGGEVHVIQARATKYRQAAVHLLILLQHATKDRAR